MVLSILGDLKVHEILVFHLESEKHIAGTVIIHRIPFLSCSRHPGSLYSKGWRNDREGILTCVQVLFFLITLSLPSQPMRLSLSFSFKIKIPSGEVPWTVKRSNQSILKEINLEYYWKDCCWSSNALATWCKQLIHWKRPWWWERL